jgi:hypothetical protein
MMSIKEKVELMIFLANGELVRHCHAVEAGILVEKLGVSTSSTTKRRRTANK